jgi:hypothetical protein
MSIRPASYGNTDPQPRAPIIAGATANGSGVATITLDPVPPGNVWLLDYVVVSSTSDLTSALNLYDGLPAASTLLDGTGSLGNSGVAVYSPPRLILGTRQLTAVWSGCTPGAACTLRVEYRLQTQDF